MSLTTYQDCNDTNNRDENKQLIAEYLCVQTKVINRLLLHLYQECKIKWDLKEKKMLPPSEQYQNPHVHAFHWLLSRGIQTVVLALQLLFIVQCNRGQT